MNADEDERKAKRRMEMLRNMFVVACRYDEVWS